MNPYNTSDIFGGSFNASAHYDAVKVQLASLSPLASLLSRTRATREARETREA